MATVARSVCPPPSPTGYAVGGEAKIEASGVIPKLIGKLLQASIGASVKADGKRWEGVLQSDLAKTQSNSLECSSRVFTHMFDAFALKDLKTYRSISKPRDPGATFKAQTPSLIEQYNAEVSVAANAPGSVAAQNIYGGVQLEAAQRHREKYLTFLQGIYSSGSDLLAKVRYQQPNEDSVRKLAIEYVDWVNNSANEIGLRMTVAAQRNFGSVKPPDSGVRVDFNPPLDPPLSVGATNTFRVIWYLLPEYLENVKYLMDHDTMDPQS